MMWQKIKQGINMAKNRAEMGISEFGQQLLGPKVCVQQLQKVEEGTV